MIISRPALSTCFIIIYARRRSAHEPFVSFQMEQQFTMASYAELSTGTNEFSSSNKIGQRSFGYVYKGILVENEMLVTVKVLKLIQQRAFKSFIAECRALRNIRY